MDQIVSSSSARRMDSSAMTLPTEFHRVSTYKDGVRVAVLSRLRAPNPELFMHLSAEKALCLQLLSCLCYTQKHAQLDARAHEAP